MSKKVLLASIIAGFVAITLQGTALAHVVVKPAEVQTAAFQTFTVSAPNEKEMPFNTVKVLIPSGMHHVTPTVKQGWRIDTEKTGEGESATVTSITWSGNTVPSGMRDEFSFSAQAPEAETDLQWKAYQTYENGETIAWDLSEAEQPKKEDGSPDFSKSGPFSVTKVASVSEATAAIQRSDQAAVDAKKIANQARSYAISGIAFGVLGFYFGTRKKRSSN
jgi:uncharacterized protein YcnI